ncbi:MAG TPA: lactoylglutathione lyase [Stenotrophomonas sp.]|jgi:hypothetical protein|nr:lactoylglutathione lyase [Stenotrophomonas sp.]
MPNVLIVETVGVIVSKRPIDHLVLPVVELAKARARLTALGFTVAPDGFHPFGTSNACVFLGDGTYLEPLAVANRRQASTTAKRGNVFTERDLAFRGVRRREGLSAVVVGTDDAPADHARFVEEGFSAGAMLEFSRPMKMPDGAESEGKFRLAFAADAAGGDTFLFACQRLAAFPSERGDLEHHANAVTGLAEVVFSAEEPATFGKLFSTVLEAEAEAPTEQEAETGTLRFAAANAEVRILSSAALSAEFNSAAPAFTPDLHARVVIFKTADLAVTEITLAANDVAFIRRDGRVLVSAAPGQGILFGFEE